MFKHKPTFFNSSFRLFIILSVLSVNAEEIPNLAKPVVVVPESIAGVTKLSAEGVIKLLTSDDSVLLIDARIKGDRENGFIESSISLPNIDTNCSSLNEISANKSRHLIFYCNGIQCGRSVASTKIARSCGYHNLSWFRGGFAEWKGKGYQYLKD